MLALLTLAVAATVFGVSATYNLVPSADARFGTATHRLELDRGPEPAGRPGAAIGAWFGTVDVIGRRVPVLARSRPWSCVPRTPRVPTAGRCWRSGRAAGLRRREVVTDAVAATLQTGVGGAITLDDAAGPWSAWSKPGRPRRRARPGRPGARRPTDGGNGPCGQPRAGGGAPGALRGRLEARPARHGAVLCATATQSERATAAAGALALAQSSCCWSP